MTVPDLVERAAQAFVPALLVAWGLLYLLDGRKHFFVIAALFGLAVWFFTYALLGAISRVGS